MNRVLITTRSIEIKLVQSSGLADAGVEFRWTIHEFTEDGIVFDLTFDDTSLVSPDAIDPDQLII